MTELLEAKGLMRRAAYDARNAQPAKEAVSQWKFKAATKDGNPIVLRTEVQVVFRLL